MSEDESYIDNKKNEKNNSSDDETSSSKYGTFFKHYIYVLAYLFIFLICGTAVLFTCKIAQSNVLPNNSECMPYTDILFTSMNSKNNDVNVNVFKSKNLSTKLDFSHNLKKTVMINNFPLIGLVKKMQQYPTTNAFFLYLSTILFELFEKNNRFYDGVYNFLNEKLNESVIIGIGPLIIGISMGFMSIFNIIYTIFLWFYNLNLLFLTNENGSKTASPDWKQHKYIEFSLNALKSWLLVFVTIGSLVINIPLVFPFITGIILNNTLISPLFLKAYVNNTDEIYGLFSLFKDILRYHMRTLMGIISVATVLLAFSDLGDTSGVFAIIAMCILFFTTEIFKKVSLENDTRLTKGISTYKQHERSCVGKLNTEDYFGGSKRKKYYRKK